ncbi:ATP-binding protein [Spirillospora sp. NPDC047279]|uniref:sensor histidine kinase n=1 Tax=Spirillospora sp. NPDC047279 TaxID=3155478 RepID=UPI0033C0F370
MTATTERPRALVREEELQHATGRFRIRLSHVYRAAAAFLVLLVVGASVQAALGLRGNAQARHTLVDRVDPAILQHFEVGTALRSQDTALRTRPMDVPAYRAAVQKETLAVAELRSMLADLPAARSTLAEVDRFTAATQAWRTAYADPLAAGGEPDAETGNRLVAEAFAQAARQRAGLITLHAAAADDLDERATVAYWSVGLALGAVALAALVAALILRRTLLTPLSVLHDRVRAVSQGDFDHSLDVKGAAEIVELATIIDAMRQRILDEWHTTAETTRRLDEQAAELRRSNAELEQFAYVASHDLQEPLRKVASFCQMIERRYGDQLDDRGKQYIDFAVDGAKRMQALINDLLSFSRVGRLSRPEEAVDLGGVMSQALDNLSTLREETAAEVTSDELPTVAGDRTQLTQLFQNLVGNAIKFRGDEAPRVHIGVRRVGDEWEFSCSDNGIGIEAHHADRVFLIFQRLHPRDEYDGTGIGLALCKKIVEHHGGRIWLDTGRPRPGEEPPPDAPDADGTPGTETAPDDEDVPDAEDVPDDDSSPDTEAAPVITGTTIRWTFPAGDDDDDD